MVVGWLTSSASASTVQFGTSSGSYTHTASGNASQYKYSSRYTSGFIHHVALTGLAPNTKYYYLVSGGEEYSFQSSPGVGAIFPYTFGFFADIGENNDADQTVQHMIAGSANIDSYVLNGDISKWGRGGVSLSLYLSLSLSHTRHTNRRTHSPAPTPPAQATPLAARALAAPLGMPSR
jgi:hypothetical protein